MPRTEKVMTASRLINELIHLPPGQKIALYSQAGGECYLATFDDDDRMGDVIWMDPDFEEEDDVKASTAEHIQMLQKVSETEKDVLRAAYQFHATGQRRGQALMNGLRMRAPELYHILTGSPNDPTHDDGKLDLALDELGFTIRRFW